MRRLMGSSLLGLMALWMAVPAEAGVATNGTLYYTRFADFSRVRSVDYSYDGAVTFGFANDSHIAALPGADGIAFDPNNGRILVGGQTTAVHSVNPGDGSFVSASTFPVPAFHLEVDPSGAFVYATGIPGAASRLPIGGAFGAAGTMMTIVGGGGVISTMISTPFGYYYTDAGAGGGGSFGSASIAGTTITLTPLLVGLPSAHGAEYDPFTGDVIVMGDGWIQQITGIGGAVSVLSSRDFGSGFQFDQGTVDGNGHLFAASNTGHLLFMDYTGTGLVGSLSNFATLPFLASFLDDVAPLVGPGAPPGGTIPEPASIATWSVLTVMGLMAARRRNK